MILLVGLGNPGDKYARNRHNIGFMAVDEIADRHGFGPERSKHQGILREGTIGTEKVVVLKPQTFMNESGRSVAAVAQFYKLSPADIVVFHDELDIAPGKLRMKAQGGHAGHNGLRSIHAHLGDGYRRARLGIGHPGDKTKVSGYVLHDFAKADMDWIGPLLASMAAEADWLARGDDQRFQSAVAQSLAPERKPARPKDRDTGPKTPEAKTEEGKSGPFAALGRLIGGS
jgi:PTH1 family peptidyl-tRNA hydrolase